MNYMIEWRKMVVSDGSETQPLVEKLTEKREKSREWGRIGGGRGW